MTDGFQLKPLGAHSAQRCPLSVPRLDPAANPLLFVINTSSGALDINPKRAVIESALAMRGRKGELMQDREAYKARFGRSRWVAFVAACATLLRAQRRLRLHIETPSSVRDLQTLTLFVGNNRLQLSSSVQSRRIPWPARPATAAWPR